jgi:hypothetical protein
MVALAPSRRYLGETDGMNNSSAWGLPWIRVAFLVVLVGAPPNAAFSQTTPTRAHGGDLSGVWDHSPAPEQRGFSGWAFSEAPPPMTPWARERFEASKPTFGPRGVMALQSNDPVYQCYPPGLPRVYFHPFPMEIIQLPGRLLMMFEYHHQNRQIYTDGRGHRDDLPPLWIGDSIGWWEGETLVVETVNFNDRTWLDRRGLPHSDQLKVVERLSLTDDGRLRIDITVEDPVAYPEPWTGQRFYERVDWQIEEFACMERNRSDEFNEFESQIMEYGEGAAP